MSDKDNKFLKKIILSYELNKNHTYTDRLMLEGELKGYNLLKRFYESSLENKFLMKEESKKNFKDKETSLKKFNPEEFAKKYQKELYELLIDIKQRIYKAQEDLCVYKAKEQIFNKLDQDLENNLINIDILEELKTKQFPLDVQARINAGLCGLKRPGKGGFVCDKELVEGTKYCKEHLKKYEPLIFAELFPIEPKTEG